jgi:phosphoglycerate kinase
VRAWRVPRSAAARCAGARPPARLPPHSYPDPPASPPASGFYGIDIGPASAAAFAQAVASSGTVFWNGPMGKFEVPEFAAGTVAVAEAMAAAGAAGAVTVVGGGDSVASVNQLGLGSSMSHISTGGGASLELVEGRGMPGLRALVQCRRERQQEQEQE